MATTALHPNGVTGKPWSFSPKAPAVSPYTHYRVRLAVVEEDIRLRVTDLVPVLQIVDKDVIFKAYTED